MINIEEVTIDITIPINEIGMVLMQPYLELTPEPFKWQNNLKNIQIERILRTLEIAKNNDLGCLKTHFTIFPEYSIPGLEGVYKIQEIIEDTSWPENTIVVGGIDAIEKKQYIELCEKFESSSLNNPSSVKDSEWINCCVVFIKSNNNLKKWIQPKICPAWTERNIKYSNMYEGKSVYFFEGKFENNLHFRFACLICFDWIGLINSEHGVFAVLKSIDNIWRSNSSDPKYLNMFFVLQHNNEPNHPDFLRNCYDFFSRKTDYPFIDRRDCVVIFSNTAGGLKPGKYSNFGFSSLIFSFDSPYDVDGCPPSFSVETKLIRKSDNLGNCKDALFRENGACTHSLKLKLPQFLNRTPTDRHFPIVSASVHSIDDSTKNNDARTLGKPVPAIIKWINDEIDDIKLPFTSPEIEVVLKENYDNITNILRWNEGIELNKLMILTTTEMEYPEVVDKWQRREIDSLETIINTFSILLCNNDIELKGISSYTTVITPNNDVIDIIIKSGGDKHGENWECGYLKKFIAEQNQKSRKTIIISRADNDYSYKDFNKREGNIYDTSNTILKCNYGDIKNCLKENNLKNLKEKIKELIGV